MWKLEIVKKCDRVDHLIIILDINIISILGSTVSISPLVAFRTNILSA